MADEKLDLAAQLTQLKQAVSEKERLRAQAEAKIDAAKQRAAEVEAQITKLGVDPAKAEDELLVLEAKLEKELAAILAEVQKESAEYRRILALGR